jgi:hypothetical protein
MTKPTNAQITALKMLADAIVDAVKAGGPLGAPAGPLYAALMDKMTLAHFEQFMSALVGAGKLRKDGDLYHAV